MKTGDKVRLIRVPDAVRDDANFPTRGIFLQCVGRVFPIVGFQHVDGLRADLIELEVGEVVGKAACQETIWVEPDCVEAVEISG
jgi:hypothetical protein